MITSYPSGTRPKEWSIEARFLALQETYRLADNDLHAWCREKEIFAHYLTQWRHDFCDSGGEKGDSVQESRELKRANQKLKGELTRKDKTLAEAAALLVLQKKFQALALSR